MKWEDSRAGGSSRATVGIGGEPVFCLYVGEQGSDDDEYPPWLWEIYIGEEAREELRYGRCASMEAAKQAAEAMMLSLLREMLATMEAT